MESIKKLVVAIHDLHPWGGQDKSNLEILYYLNKKVPIEIHAYQFIDTRTWPNVDYVKYQGLRRPLFIKALSYALRTFWLFKKNHRDPSVAIQSTGTAAWSPDVFQIQFLHKAWQHLQNNYDLDDEGSFLHGLYHQFLQNFNIWLENRVYKKNKKYIAVSHSIKKELIEHFKIPEKNICTIYHGVDTDFFSPRTSVQAMEIRARIRTELRIPEDALVFLHTGALNQRKGVPLALETLGHLKREGFTNIHYIAVGAGSISNLKKIVESENITETVHFIQHTKNIRDYYWSSDVFFFPTVYEPFGLVILEAMACGLTCVVSPSAGAAELIVHQKNGLLLENILDPESMAQQLSEVLKDRTRMAQLAQEAVATAQEHRWETAATQYWDFYKNLSR